MSGKSDDQGATAAEKAPHYHGHRARLRQRFLEAGSEAVSDYELLELILFRAIPQRDVKPLAKELIATFGSFAEVIAAPRHRLAELKGLGDAAITELKVVQAAASRLARGAVSKRQLLTLNRKRYAHAEFFGFEERCSLGPFLISPGSLSGV